MLDLPAQLLRNTQLQRVCLAPPLIYYIISYISMYVPIYQEVSSLNHARNNQKGEISRSIHRRNGRKHGGSDDGTSRRRSGKRPLVYTPSKGLTPCYCVYEGNYCKRLTRYVIVSIKTLLQGLLRWICY